MWSCFWAKAYIGGRKNLLFIVEYLFPTKRESDLNGKERRFRLSLRNDTDRAGWKVQTFMNTYAKRLSNTGILPWSFGEVDK